MHIDSNNEFKLWPYGGLVRWWQGFGEE